MNFSRVYSSRSGLVLGFHGTDESVVRDVVLNTKFLKASENTWDWIGHGVYFWEHSPERALQFAEKASKRRGSIIHRPAVLGAVIDLGHCLDLLDYGNLSLIMEAYESLKQRPDFSMLKNRRVGNSATDFLIRDLDCSVIETVHDLRANFGLVPFDSVKAVFWEGNLLYPNAGFREKNHIQICIRNPNCIKGFFLPIHRRV